MEALEAGRAGPAGQPDLLVDACDCADGGELLAGAGDEQDLLFVTGVEPEGEVHAREDDDVVEGDQGQGLLGAVRFHLAEVLSRSK